MANKLKDHRQIGQEQELFFVHEYAPGAIFWLPKGMILVKQLEQFIREQNIEHKFHEVQTPILVKSRIFQQSGHFKYYEHHMYNMELEHERYSLKPMNCPETALIYQSKTRSYKDLPLKYSEYGRLHRRELSGVVGGLLRVTEFTQDDGHIFLRNEQLEDEILNILKWIDQFHALMGFRSKFYLGTKPDRALGDAKIWKMAESALENALKKSGVNFEVREKDGVFYGPKIDVDVTDIQKRTWTVSTVQVDFNIPTQFKLKYTDENGKSQKPVMIHRSIFGSFERFIGILIEHFQGAFPVWLSPVQVVIIPISEKHIKYATQVRDTMILDSIRVEVDKRAETMQAKIRDAQTQKIPYMLIVGDREEKGKKIAVRTRTGQDLGVMDLQKFMEKIKIAIKQKEGGF